MLKKLYRFGTLEAYEHIESLPCNSPSATNAIETLKGPFRVPFITTYVAKTVLSQTGLPVYFDGQATILSKGPDLYIQEDETRYFDLPSGEMSLLDIRTHLSNDELDLGIRDDWSQVHAFVPFYVDSLDNSARFLSVSSAHPGDVKQKTVWPFDQRVGTAHSKRYGPVYALDYVDVESAFLRIENLIFKAHQQLPSPKHAPVPIGFRKISLPFLDCDDSPNVANSLDVMPAELHSLLNAASRPSCDTYLQYASWLITYLEDIHLWAVHLAKFIDATFDISRHAFVYWDQEQILRVIRDVCKSNLLTAPPVFVHPDTMRKVWKQKDAITMTRD